MNAIFVIGDVHGQRERLLRLLCDAGLVGKDETWRGGEATLWFLGDLVDRGPDGIGVVDLVMQLQPDAAAAGGRVGALLGNHDILLVAAHRFGRRPTSGPGGTFRAEWERNGGVAADLVQLTANHVAWLTRLPAMAREGDRLLIHADALFYAGYGESVAEVNRDVAAVLASDDVGAWDRLLGEFGERDAFVADGGERAVAFLRRFGGRQLLHGHTPISYASGLRAEQVRGPLVYAEGRCINVDGGMYLGGPGFVYELPPVPSFE